MCEIVRAIIAAGLLSPITSDVTNIPPEALNYISCPGTSGSFKICAVNGISYHKTDMWTILLESANIQVNSGPKFSRIANVKADDFKPALNASPIIDKSLLNEALMINSPSDPEILKMIAASKSTIPVDIKKPEDPWKKVYLKFSNPAKESIQANAAGWNYFESGSVDFAANTDVYVICYSMINGLGLRTRLAVRLVLDDNSQISTRMIQGYLNRPTTTTAFVSQLQVGRHTVKTQYKSTSDLGLDADKKEDQNISTGLVVIPKEGLFLKKIINPVEIQLFNDNSWADFPNLSANIKLTKTAHCMIMYNLSLPGMQSHIVTRVDINTMPIIVSQALIF
jgi:hypothetical protein